MISLGIVVGVLGGTWALEIRHTAAMKRMAERAERKRKNSMEPPRAPRAPRREMRDSPRRKRRGAEGKQLDSSVILRVLCGEYVLILFLILATLAFLAV
jgi:Flp pilus assembly protein TadB